MQHETNYFSLFAAHINSLSAHGGELRGCCPFHEDKSPSWTGNRITGLWRCFGCGARGNASQFAERMGKTATMSNGHQQRKIIATYDYRDEQNTLLYQAVRFEPKGFAQRRPDGNGGWTYSLSGVRRVLYRLPEIAKAETIYVAEGEKDVDRLWSLGISATTNPQGAGKWREEYNESLKGKRIVIIPDNDEVGEQHAKAVAHSLLSVAKAVKIVSLPNLPPKGDVSDWFDAGHTKEELTQVVKSIPTLKEAPSPQLGSPESHRSAVTRRFSDIQRTELQWLWLGRIPLGKLTVVDGDPGLGKSLLAVDVGARISTARAMPDGTTSDQSEPAGVVFLSAEDDPSDTIRPRLEAAGADLSRISILEAVRQGEAERLPTLSDLDQIRQAIEEVNAKLVIIDPLMAYLPSKVDSHKDQDIRSILSRLAKLAAELGVAVLVVRHLNKLGSGKAIYRGGGSIGIIGAARSALLVAKDPDDEERRILAPTKSNLAKLAPALAYCVEATENGVPWVKWLGGSQHTADSLVVQPTGGEEQSALDEAKEFLRQVLAQEAREAKDVHREARNAGISEATLRRAKTALRVIVRKQGNFLAKEQKWVWSLPEDAHEGAQGLSEDAQTHAHEHLQTNSEKNSRKDANFSEDAQGSENEHLQSQNEHLQGWEDDL
jgi:putative DNA primase/helicase